MRTERGDVPTWGWGQSRTHRSHCPQAVWCAAARHGSGSRLRMCASSPGNKCCLVRRGSPSSAGPAPVPEGLVQFWGLCSGRQRAQHRPDGGKERSRPSILLCCLATSRKHFLPCPHPGRGEQCRRLPTSELPLPMQVGAERTGWGAQRGTCNA